MTKRFRITTAGTSDFFHFHCLRGLALYHTLAFDVLLFSVDIALYKATFTTLSMCLAMSGSVNDIDGAYENTKPDSEFYTGIRRA